jgi:hypothetical protein
MRKMPAMASAVGLGIRLVLVAVLGAAVTGCSPGTNPVGRCPVEVRDVTVRFWQDVGVSMTVPKGWWETLASGEQSASATVSDRAEDPRISLVVGRFDVPFEDDFARQLLRADGVEMGETVVTLGDDRPRSARVVQFAEASGIRRTTEVFLPDPDGGTLIVRASTPAELADTCRGQIDQLLRTLQVLSQETNLGRHETRVRRDRPVSAIAISSPSIGSTG